MSHFLPVRHWFINLRSKGVDEFFRARVRSGWFSIWLLGDLDAFALRWHNPFRHQPFRFTHSYGNK